MSYKIEEMRLYRGCYRISGIDIDGILVKVQAWDIDEEPLKFSITEVGLQRDDRASNAPDAIVWGHGRELTGWIYEALYDSIVAQIRQAFAEAEQRQIDWNAEHVVETS